MDEQRGFQFPCEIPIKAMGRANAEFEDRVRSIVDRHMAGDDGPYPVLELGVGASHRLDRDFSGKLETALLVHDV